MEQSARDALLSLKHGEVFRTTSPKREKRLVVLLRGGEGGRNAQSGEKRGIKESGVDNESDPCEASEDWLDMCSHGETEDPDYNEDNGESGRSSTPSKRYSSQTLYEVFVALAERLYLAFRGRSRIIGSIVKSVADDESRGIRPLRREGKQ